ncbi:MAG: Hpt domain-containing protein, partial [Lachnospiraceae bacterium]|nr:Hpt domain-containing protein [Lachnospiraceae bacterium]
YHRSVPIIALSANTIEGVEALFKSAGMNDFLPKPVEIGLLEACLKKWLPPEKVTVTTIEYTNDSTQTGNKFGGFKYIDVTTGLTYTNGNADMYNSLIKDFSASIRDKKDSIDQLAEIEDVGRFTIEVHSLKSTSKMLGALSLSEKALELERLGHKRDIQAIHEKLPSLNEEIDKIIMDLRSFSVQEEAPIVKRKPVDREAIRQSMRSLFYAADDFDYDGAKDIISAISIYNFDDRLEAVFEKMQDRIEDIDYEGTRQAAVEMLAML